MYLHMFADADKDKESEGLFLHKYAYFRRTTHFISVKNILMLKQIRNKA